MNRATDTRTAWLCALLAVAAVLATIPILEMGTNDDWSYIRVVRELAATGHFRFNGWVSAMIGIQALWAALLVKIFGFSFTLVRLSTLPFVAASSILLYRLGRRIGLNSSYAVLATLTITLSPVFLPLAASFMTDVPAFCFWLAAASCGLRALQSESSKEAGRWIVWTAALGVAGGTIRQVDWFIPLFAIPVLAWLRRGERSTLRTSAIAWSLSVAAILICTAWFDAQPYAITRQLREPHSFLDRFGWGVETVAQLAVESLLLILPVLLAPIGRWRKWVLGAAAVPAALLAILWWFDDDLLLGNVLTATGMLDELDLPGDKPELLGDPLLWCIAIVMVVGAAFTLPLLFERALESRQRALVLVLGLPSAVYLAALVYRSVLDRLYFDRYVILFLPLLILPVLWHAQQHRSGPPWWSWTALAVVAVFAVAYTHDYFAVGRARVQAADQVIASGVPRTRLSAGLEYDGWTQLEATGRILTPHEVATTPPPAYPVKPPFWFWKYTRAIDPAFVVSYSKLPGLVDAGFPPVAYRTWLPPFDHKLVIQRSPEAIPASATRPFPDPGTRPAPGSSPGP